MKIYGVMLSPFVRKVHVICAEKGLSVESVPVGMGSKDPGFLAASPFRKIPAIDDDGFLLSDSSAIAHYLEAKYPAVPMLPADAEGRARAVQYDEIADTVLVPAFAKLFFNRIVAPRFLKREGDLAAADKAEAEELPPLFDWVETVCTDGWLVGKAFGLADIAMAAPFVNIEMAGCVPDATRWPRLSAWLGRVRGRASFTRLAAVEAAILRS